jgi:7-cyano-7-deazaguanine synthase in queuosine biosynthesis
MKDLRIIIPANKTIGLSISGGADSAILAYYLMKNLDSPVHFFIYASKEKQNRTINHSLAVISKCQELTEKKDVHVHIRYAPSQERLPFLNYLVNSNIVDIVYTGTTSIPPSNVIKTFSEKLAEDITGRRDPVKIKPLWSHGNKLYHPFFNIDKKGIAELYTQFGLLDTLFPLTFSCESLAHTDTHCGQCWWCQERVWAFGKL